MLIIKNGTILTMDADQTRIESGTVVCQGTEIIYAGPSDHAPAGLQAEIIDAGGGLILPGLTNCHSHVSMTLMRGLADDLPLSQWLEEHIFPTERNLDGETVYWGAMLGCLEMIKSGTTCFSDMYLFAEYVAKAIDETGLRSVLGEVIYDFPSPSYGELENGYAATRDLIAHYKDHERISGAVMTHALYTCSEPLMRTAVEMRAETGADLVIHLAETAIETGIVSEKWGKRPYEVMEYLEATGPKLLIDHAVDLSDAEIERAVEAGVRVAHCPESNMKLGSGVMPLKKMLAAGLTVGLGTDGCASNNNLDMLGEMDTCAKLSKVATLDPTSAPADAVLAMATSQGAKAMGLEDRIGVLAPGMLADVIVVDTSRPHMTPLYNPVSQLVYSARGADVLHTVCHGKVLMKDRKAVHLDEERIMNRFRECADKLTGGKLL